MKLVRAWVSLAAVAAFSFGTALAAPVTTEKSKAEEPGKIEGMAIARPNGGSLGLAIKDNHFVLSFYDAAKHKVAPDVARAAMRWPVKYQKPDERVVLTLGGDGKSLTSDRAIRLPHTFKVFISLFAEGNETAVESYNVDFSQAE